MNPAVFPRRIPPLAALSARSQVPWPNRPAARSPRRLPSPHPRIPCRPLSATSRCSLFGFGSDKNANPSSAEEEPLPYYSPHQPKRQWPPDVSKLSPKHQFRLERRYRRRAALKWERPRWKKWTKIVQYALYAYIIVYAIFFIDWGEDHPIQMFRDYLLSSVRSAFSAPPPAQSLRRPDQQAKE